MPALETVRKEITASEFILRQPLRPKKCPDQPKQRAKKARRIKVSISIGAAEAGGERSAEAVIRQADKMLYRAKQGGRNRVEH